MWRAMMGTETSLVEMLPNYWDCSVAAGSTTCNVISEQCGGDRECHWQSRSWGSSHWLGLCVAVFSLQLELRNCIDQRFLSTTTKTTSWRSNSANIPIVRCNQSTWMDSYTMVDSNHPLHRGCHWLAVVFYAGFVHFREASMSSFLGSVLEERDSYSTVSCSDRSHASARSTWVNSFFQHSQELVGQSHMFTISLD